MEGILDTKSDAATAATFSATYGGPEILLDFAATMNGWFHPMRGANWRIFTTAEVVFKFSGARARNR
jgi:hypothetical protein